MIRDHGKFTTLCDCELREDIAPPVQVRAIEQPDVLAWGGFGPPDSISTRPHGVQPVVCI